MSTRHHHHHRRVVDYCPENDDDDDAKDVEFSIEEELKEKDYTMLVEVVTRTQQDEDMCAVVIKEGRVVKDRGTVTC